ncbi:protein phosphatase methylesterase 1 isoform X1 [Periplaneta americana]|uniref:protein phosphatase methylesterase 1 isoform X1 n=1 Tax=Periplaneta americana TaxID=6978 RepID=UPI0037E7D812
MSTLQKTILKAKLPPIVPIGSLGSRGVRKGGIGRKRDYTPVQWNRYFSERRDVAVNGNKFRVYSLGDTGPLLVLLHGGGFSALTWSLFATSVTSYVECQVLAIDLRGHGDTITTNEEDLSAETMARDVGDIIRTLYGSEPPPIILIGHSMGGAIAVHTASANYIPSLIGLAVIDVVEGTALDALASMQSFLRGRPTHFKSLEHAIEWCLRSGQVRNLESAKVSMPGQIKNSETGKLATNDIDTYVPVSQGEELKTSVLSSDAIREEENEASSSDGQTAPAAEFKPPPPLTENSSQKYVWRIDLGRTEKYWSGWFQGLSNTFLSCPVPKMLLLAGIDRLDRDLTVGQMQGKFQMQVLPQCGHAVHEDVPDKVAEVLATFMVRHRFAVATSNFERTFPAC